MKTRKCRFCKKRHAKGTAHPKKRRKVRRKKSLLAKLF